MRSSAPPMTTKMTHQSPNNHPVPKKASDESTKGDPPPQQSQKTAVRNAEQRPTPPVEPIQTESPRLATAPAVPAAPVTTTGVPPNAPTTPDAKLEHSRENLARIGVALNRYVAERGAFPTPAIYDSSKRPLLSWRVALLPFLGHWDLYQQFDRDEPWNSHHNKTLIAHIPPVYQSPERWDEKTNYLAISGRSTLFYGPRPVAPRRVEDGRENTMAIVEADDALAVPWTKPDDYQVQLSEPLLHLGGLREGRFLALLGDGIVMEVSADAPEKMLWASFTFDGGESFTSGDLYAVEIAVPKREDQPPPAQTVVDAPDPSKLRTSSRQVARPTETSQLHASRYDVPSVEDQRAAKKLVEDLFRKKFDEADSASERKCCSQGDARCFFECGRSRALCVA